MIDHEDCSESLEWEDCKKEGHDQDCYVATCKICGKVMPDCEEEES